MGVEGKERCCSKSRILSPLEADQVRNVLMPSFDPNEAASAAKSCEQRRPIGHWWPPMEAAKARGSHGSVRLERHSPHKTATSGPEEDS